MIVGIMADTHDRLPMLKKAVERLNEERAELILHAGDYIAPFVVRSFKALKSNLIGVFGNNDGDKELLRRRFAEIGGDIRGDFAEVKVDGLKVVMLHGHEEELLRSLIGVDSYDVVVHGHTHEARVHKQGKTLVVNPGETCGYLTGKSSIAFLDTEMVEAKIALLE